ncbi:MAG: tol-pal system YbgF family protein [bacterium]
MKLSNRFIFLVITGWSVVFVFASVQITYSSPISAFTINKSSNNQRGLVQQGKSTAEIDRLALYLYNEAVKKYEKKLYWKSAVDLIVILDFYTEFTKLDDVIYLLGNCLYEMGMYDGADRMYRYLLKTIPRTPNLPDALLGLQKVFYQKKDYKKSLRFYRALEAHYSHFNGINESRYYAGQAYFHLGNYTLVPQILRHVSTRSEFYAFGLYTSGLAHLKKKT